MALLITDKCINCDMCLPECPNDAIYEGAKVYEIDVNRCTECVGFYEHQTCVHAVRLNALFHIRSIGKHKNNYWKNLRV